MKPATTLKSIHWLQTLLKHVSQTDICSSAGKWQSLLRCASWSVLTWRQTESLSVQLRNLMTTARGEPCITAVHLSGVLELHPSFLSLFFGTKSKDEPRIWRQLRAVICLLFLHTDISATSLVLFLSPLSNFHFEQELFSKLRYCSLLRTYGTSAILKCFQSVCRGRWWQTPVFEGKVGSSSSGTADVWRAMYEGVQSCLGLVK